MSNCQHVPTKPKQKEKPKRIGKSTCLEHGIWLVVSTHLKNISQNGNLAQVGVKIKNVWNHQVLILGNPFKINLIIVILGNACWRSRWTSTRTDDADDWWLVEMPVAFLLLLKMVGCFTNFTSKHVYIYILYIYIRILFYWGFEMGGHFRLGMLKRKTWFTWNWMCFEKNLERTGIEIWIHVIQLTLSG